MCYVILADLHANYTALQAIEESIKPLGRTQTLKRYFLGDLLGYGPVEQALRCLLWLRFESGICAQEEEGERRWLPGNHDEWAISRLGRVRDEGAVTLLAQRRALMEQAAQDWQWFEGQVRAAMAEETHSLITRLRQAGNADLFLAFAHGGVLDPERRSTNLRPWQPSILRAHFEPLRAMSGAALKILFCGHTHLPLLAEIRDGDREIVYHSIKYGRPIHLEPGEYIINPGSAGHPRDGDPRAAFALFDPDACTVEFRRVDYDIRRVVDALRLEQGNSARAREEAARYLIGLDAEKLRQEQGIEVNPEEPGQHLLNQYLDRVSRAYDRLVRELETGDGGEEMQHYHKIYRTPQWDLEAVDRA